MKIKRLVSGGAAAALALGLAAVSAKAEIVTVTFQGVVTSGSDQTGVFGSPGADLTGASYTAVYTVNDAVNAHSINEPTIMSQIFGGTMYGDQSPTSATLTINGVTVSIGGDYYSRTWQSTLAQGHAEVFDLAQSTGDDGTNTSNLYLEDRMTSPDNAIVTSSDYHTPLSYTYEPHDYPGGSFTDTVMNDTTGLYSVNVTASLDPTSVTVADGAGGGGGGPTPGVPEPAVWTMLILGLAMIGSAARRRNGAAAIAA